MKPIPNNTDWSASAAWIALAISIIVPAITTWLNNRHQEKLRKLDLQEKAVSEKYHVLENCISAIGGCIANPDASNLVSFGKAYFPVYAYVPQQNWPLLDNFYTAMNSIDLDEAATLYPDVIHLLSSLLTSKEKPQKELLHIWRLSLCYNNHSIK